MAIWRPIISWRPIRRSDHFRDPRRCSISICHGITLGCSPRDSIAVLRCDTLISLTVDFTSDSAINVREEERQKLAEGRPTTRPQSSRPRRETTWHVWCSVVVPWGSKQAFATPCFASAVAVGSSWLARHRHMKPLLFESLASRARPAAAGMPTCVCPG